MNEEFGTNLNEGNKNRALDAVREYPLAPSGMYPYYTEEEEIHLRDYLQIILSRKWMVLTFFLAVVTTVTIGTFMTKPQYKATSTIKIDKENNQVLVFKDSYSVDNVDDKYYQTQYKVLKSRNLAKRVIRKMKLDSNPEFSARASDSPQPAEASFLTQNSPLNSVTINSALVDKFINRIEVDPEPKSSLVNVSFISYSPDMAASVANAISLSFIELNVESKFEATQQARTWLENQIEVMKAKLEQAEEKLNEYAASNEIIFLDYNVDKEGKGGGTENIITKKLADLSAELTSATSDRISKEALYNEVMSGEPGTSSLVMGNPVIQSLRQEAAALDAEYSQNLKTFKPDYPKMVRLKEHITQIQKRMAIETRNVVASVKKDYEAAVKRENYLKAAFEKQKQDALDLNNRSVQYQILKREADTNRELYNGLLQRLKETGVTASITASNIQVLDRAEVPKSPFKPNKTRNILLSVIIGLFGGIGLAFFADYLDNTVKTPEDVEKKIYMPSLGLVPLYSAKDQTAPIDFISHSDTKSQLTEAYTSIRTFLLFSTAGKPPKVMMVTSARREEGKTTTAINTAISLTKSNSRVVLVDADMRKPRIHKTFKVSNTSGLSSFLSGNVEFGDELIKNTNIPGLDVVTAGPLPPNPAELLSSYRLRDLIEGLYPLYNFIVFDTPPVLGLADSAIASTQTDGVILVVRSGQTPKEAAQQAKRILESVNAKVLGVVLNAINETNLRYGYSSYYQYYYQQYGADEDK